MDRNMGQALNHLVFVTSLSARRAWIEIIRDVSLNYKEVVALRKESVDRNHNSVRRCLMSVGRSPQGERG